MVAQAEEIRSQEDLWAELSAIELPSENEHRAKAESAFEDYDFPEGNYQWAVTGISRKFDNKYSKDPNAERRAITFTCVAENGQQAGPHIGHSRQGWFNISSHPTSALYPILKAAAGGYLDPNVRPNVAELLRDAQFTASLVMVPSKDDPSKLYPQFQAVFPAREKLPVVPF